MTAKEHNKLTGIFLMIHGGLQAFIMGLLSLIYGGVGLAILLGGKNDEKFVGLIFIFVILALVVFSVLFLGPQLIGGWKLYKEKPNARIWGIIGSVTACLSFPLGTAAGAYGLWFLCGDLGKQFYQGVANQNYLGAANNVNEFNFNEQRQQQPHSWK